MHRHFAMVSLLSIRRSHIILFLIQEKFANLEAIFGVRCDQAKRSIPIRSFKNGFDNFVKIMLEHWESFPVFIASKLKKTCCYYFLQSNKYLNTRYHPCKPWKTVFELIMGLFSNVLRRVSLKVVKNKLLDNPIYATVINSFWLKRIPNRGFPIIVNFQPSKMKLVSARNLKWLSLFQKSPDLVEPDQRKRKEILIIIKSNIRPVCSPSILIEHLNSRFHQSFQ